ncbi:MAG: extracellular solute-binding protein [Candidatus Uhrbacteria bacterium]|nr:extracellular solute-binding protein [Patescibacteria group bacterium]MBU1907435.1 extracellular solute-binding protein [Patescibacteria group bacterium]
MKKLIFLTLVASLMITSGQGCLRGGSSEAQQAALEKVTLEYWRVFDSSDVFKELIASYREIHPNINVSVTKMRFEEYEDELVQAFAEDRGPDMFSIHDTWMTQYQPLITPLPKSLSLVYQETKGTLKKETVAVIKEEPTITVRELQTAYVDVVADDVVLPYQPDPRSSSEDRIWGLPYSVDTMVLFYNKDLLNAAGIAESPATWRDFQTAVSEMTLVDLDGGIVQAGAALGTTKNVERAFDLISLLMMQNGTQMTHPTSGRATFAEVPDGATSKIPPGLTAVQFYTDFANPVKEVYTWNAKQPDSFEAFVNGTTAFFFGYSYHIPLIRSRNPKLNFDIGAMPQISGGKTVNYANYWIEVVSKTSDHQDEAWDFIQYVADAEQVTTYLDKANKPTALRELINTQLEDLDLSIFASQILTAQNWYSGEDPVAAESAMLDMVENILAGVEDPEDELEIAQSKVNQTL